MLSFFEPLQVWRSETTACAVVGWLDQNRRVCLRYEFDRWDRRHISKQSNQLPGSEDGQVAPQMLLQLRERVAHHAGVRVARRRHPIASAPCVVCGERGHPPGSEASCENSKSRRLLRARSMTQFVTSAIAGRPSSSTSVWALSSCGRISRLCSRRSVVRLLSAPSTVLRCWKASSVVHTFSSSRPKKDQCRSYVGVCKFES